MEYHLQKSVVLFKVRNYHTNQEKETATLCAHRKILNFSPPTLLI